MKSINPIKFGTDGWRAIIAQDFTFDSVGICAQAVADYVKKAGLASCGLVIGHDTRFASEDFAAVAAEVVAGNGIKVFLCPGATPTPVISYGTLALKAGGAIIITASHNPATWNGFKYKIETGSSAPPEVTTEIETNITHVQSMGKIKRMTLSAALKQGLIEYLDLAPIYFDQVKKLIDLNKLRRAELKVVIDSMWGAGAGYLKALLSGGTMNLIEIHGGRNPLFPEIERPEPIMPNLMALSAKVKEQKASVGLATDGDGDRMGVIDENGVFLTQLQVFALLCLYLLEVRGERGPIVKTLTTTSMVYRLGEIFNVPVFETPVGFRYVAPVMVEQNALIGGEESGGYGFRGHVLERDGVLANLYFLDLMVTTGKSPSELLAHLYRKVGVHHYQRRDIKFPEKERKTITRHLKQNAPDHIGGVKVARFDTTDGFRFLLADGAWLLIRFSGTEPVMRIYAEDSTPSRVGELLAVGRNLTGV
ncbi:MAG: phosphoglucomutase/phosphomannomutase family protein [Dehalococcoidales bacterium]|jgi:alpha-D-glucose phosphate-specific phosphoglucomutase|nr:phosphoglucomutase/phosphomannomutase family protein [Dehalococcoidales bacterium]MDP6737588.1 phosphoglucomutase/phosphomannomutase family protein [Dehalococcoidales bacterium]|tara:strand:+ start:365 stop:1798 length:1434 start_codon:yes stop_codon:yes gene_type:complete